MSASQGMPLALGGRMRSTAHPKALESEPLSALAPVENHRRNTIHCEALVGRLRVRLEITAPFLEIFIRLFKS
jgi:hypothetical protein